MNRKNSFLKNTLILFTAMFITKIIGAVLRIPLTNMLGGIGMGYFSTAYSFFNPVYTVLAAGLPTIVTKLTAQSSVCGKYREARKIKRASLILSFVAGFIGTAFMLLLAVPFADFAAKSSDSVWAVLMISPSVIFCCIAAAYRGYYEGLSDMLPTALSQVIESVIKAILGLGFSAIVLHLGDIGKIAEDKVLPYAAAAAILGVTAGEFGGTLFLILRSKLRSDGIMTEDLSKSPIAESTFEIIKKLIVQSLPISLGAVIINLSSLIDLLTISGGIQEVFVEKSDFFLTHYPIAVKESGVDNIGNFVYGSYTGIVLSLFMIITSLTSLIGKSALPGIASAYECGKKDELKKQVNILLSGIFIIGLPLCMSLSLLSEPVLSLLYPLRPAEVSVSITPLSVLCAGGIPIALCSGIFSVFQATGRSDIPIKLMMTGSVVKLIFNLLFIRIPFLSFSGAALSTVVSHITVSILGIIYLNKILEIECRPFSLMSRPFIAASACAAVSAFSHYILFDMLNDIIRMLLSVAAGGLTYSVTLLLVDKRLIELLKNYRKKKISV